LQLLLDSLENILFLGIAVYVEKQRLDFVEALLNLPEKLRVNLLASCLQLFAALEFSLEECLQVAHQLFEEFLVLREELAHSLALLALFVLHTKLHLLQLSQQQGDLVPVGLLAALLRGAVETLEEVLLVDLGDCALVADVDLAGETSPLLGELMQQTVLALGEGVLELQVDELVGLEVREPLVEDAVDGTGDRASLLRKAFDALRAEGVAAV
jgi:hypothetical protein